MVSLQELVHSVALVKAVRRRRREAGLQAGGLPRLGVPTLERSTQWHRQPTRDATHDEPTPKDPQAGKEATSAMRPAGSAAVNDLRR